MQPTRLVIVDAHDLTRHGLQMLVTTGNSSIDVIGSFQDLQSCQSCLNQQHPHVLLLGDSLPRKLDIFSTIHELHTYYPTLSIVVLSSKLSVRYVQKVLQQGARGFIYKEDRLRDLLVIGIETVRSGGVYLSPQASVLPYLGDAKLDHGSLRAIDLQVLRLMAQDQTVQEIAEQLTIADRSVYRIRTRLRTALNVRTNEQIVDTARKQGLLTDLTE